MVKRTKVKKWVSGYYETGYIDSSGKYCSNKKLKKESKSEAYWTAFLSLVFIGTMLLVAFGKLDGAVYTHFMAFGIGMWFYREVINK